MIEISVVVCTYNRAGMLAGAIESLVGQTLDGAEFEIMIVDNASTDSTPEVVRQLQERYATHNMSLVHEHNQGLGHARNAGARHARGRYVAYMDDDAKASPDWLEKGLACFREVLPQPLAVGGPILPWYDSPKPEWFKDEYALRTWGEDARFLKLSESFSGSNMILDKATLQAAGGFDAHVGVKGEMLSVGEETSLFRNIGRMDSRPALYYSPGLVVYHLCPAGHMRISYKLKRAFATGQSSYYLHGPKSAGGRIDAVLKGCIGLMMVGTRALLAKRHYQARQNWLWERVTPVVSLAGYVAASAGVNIQVRHRDA